MNRWFKKRTNNDLQNITHETNPTKNSMSFLLELRTVQTAFYYLLCIGGFFGSILHSIDNTSTLLTYVYIVKILWLEIAEILKNKCNVELPILAQHIILGSDMLDYSINLLIVILSITSTFPDKTMSNRSNKYIKMHI